MTTYRRPRYPTTVPVVVETLQRRVLAKALNVNETGMRLLISVPVEEGDALTVHHLQNAIGGTVSWARGRVVGMKFDAPISAKAVDDMRQGARRGTQKARFDSSQLRQFS